MVTQENVRVKRDVSIISQNIYSDDARFIEEIARQKACDIQTAQEKIEQMILLCPAARKSSMENVYSWIDENWNNYQLVSF